MRKTIANILKYFNYKITRDRSQEYYPADFLEAYNKITPYSMVDKADAYAAWQAVEYVVNNEIEGAIVECGVWRGGVSILMAECLKKTGAINRKQYLFDTFEGMSEPTTKDVDKHGKTAAAQLKNTTRSDSENNVWAYASIEDVKQNFLNSDINPNDLHLIKGKVEDTIPNEQPSKIAVLRLDTDWYESTKHELTHMYPLLTNGGVLLIDDYGYWSGCKEAVDEYFTQKAYKPFFSTQPSGSIIAIKVDPKQNNNVGNKRFHVA